MSSGTSTRVPGTQPTSGSVREAFLANVATLAGTYVGHHAKFKMVWPELAWWRRREQRTFAWRTVSIRLRGAPCRFVVPVVDRAISPAGPAFARTAVPFGASAAPGWTEVAWALLAPYGRWHDTKACCTASMDLLAFEVRRVAGFPVALVLDGEGATLQAPPWVEPISRVFASQLQTDRLAVLRRVHALPSWQRDVVGTAAAALGASAADLLVGLG